jgi:hypothetical protein
MYSIIHFFPPSPRCTRGCGEFQKIRFNFSDLTKSSFICYILFNMSESLKDESQRGGEYPTPDKNISLLHERVPLEEKTIDVVRFSDEQKNELGKRGRTVYVELHGETLERLEKQTGTESNLYLHGQRAEKAATVPAMRGVEVAINLDSVFPEDTFGEPFDTQMVILKNAHNPIDGITDANPQTPADAVAVAVDVEKQTGVNILSGRYTRVGKDGSLIVGLLNPGVNIRVNDHIEPDWPDGNIGLLSLAVPTLADGR